MIVLILVALWIVVLVPAFVKKWLDRRSNVSIDTFHQQLHLLERAQPKLVSPAFRLETAESVTGIAVGQSGYPAVSSRPSRPNLVLLKPVRDDDAETGSEDEVVDGSSGQHFRRVLPPALDEVPSRQLAAERVEELHRYQVRRRRRDLLFGLAGTLVLTGLIGLAVPVFWVLTVLAAITLACYVGLAFYAQLLEADQRVRSHRPRGVASAPWHVDPRHGIAEPWGPTPDQGAWATVGIDQDAWDDAGEYGVEAAPRAVAR